MNSELELYLTDDMPIDYWYDEAINICVNEFDKFSHDDWNDLLVALPLENNCTNKRIAECLETIDSVEADDCLFKLLDKQDRDLCITVIDSLRSHNANKWSDSKKNELMNLTELLMSTATSMQSKIIGDFIKKMQKN